MNANPSLNIYFEGEYMAAQVLKDTQICPVDLYVKTMVVKDAIKLAKKSDSLPDSSGSLKKIYPNEDDTDGAYVSDTIV